MTIGRAGETVGIGVKWSLGYLDPGAGCQGLDGGAMGRHNLAEIGRRARAASPETIMTPTWSLQRLHAVDDAQIDQLAAVLIDCVEGDASISFMHPLTRDRAVAFWRRVAEGVSVGERALLIAEDAQGLCGTVQLVLEQPENQPHRADLAKMLVHRRARRQGLGAALMRAAENMARECGKTLLVLDAVTGGAAARLYERLGWVRVGDIPGYALMPRGGLCSTTYFYRDLSGP
jgi:GNAT superfamily N-acetyltransferase